jgi:gamma-glutamylcyclotransferase (GGCT)/AIG2-like uncharacterized protein YtfP
MAADPVLIFSYGKLQHEEVQRATFGRELAGRMDSLPGYRREIKDSGGVLYYNIEPSALPEDAVSGTLFEITEKELVAADQYEKDRDYHRISATLRSGAQAWVYIRA